MSAQKVKSPTIKQKKMHTYTLASGNGHIKSGVQELIDSLPFYVFLVDTDHRVVMANNKIRDALGIEPENITGMYCPTVVHGLDEPFPGCPLEDAVISGKPVEKRLYDKNTGRWTLSAVYPTQFQTGKGKAIFLHTARDITDAVRNEEENKLKAQLLDASTDSIFMVDGNGRFQYMNDATYKTRGYKTKEELMEIPLLKLDPPEFAKLIDERIKQILEKGEFTFETAHYRKDGSVMPLEIHSKVIDYNGQKSFLSVARDITSRKAAAEELIKNYDIQHVINRLLSLSLEDVPLEDILRQALDMILAIPWLVSQTRGSIMMVEDEPDVLVMKVQNGLAEPIKKTCGKVPFGRCMCGLAAKNKRIEFADALDKRHVTTYEGISPHGHYCVPIMYSDRVLGVINVYTREGHQRNQREEEFLSSVANTLAGIIIRKEDDEMLSRTLKSLEMTIEGTVQSMALVVETRDPYTAGHQRRVADLSVVIAKELGLPEDETEGIKTAATVHDIGKINVPAEILTKPGRLTDIEFGIIKTHAGAGYNILKHIQFPWPVAMMVLQHHERLDGSGYPHHRKAKDIIKGAKILAVADVVEAMSTHRPYRPALGVNTALAEIKKNKGNLYDAEVVDACVKVFKHGFTFHE